MSIGENLKYLRSQTGKSQEDVALDVGIATATLCAYENDKRNMSAYNVVLLAKYYGISSDKILGLKPLVETRLYGLYDSYEKHDNCTVEIYRNSITGQVSFGWWENDKEPAVIHIETED